MYTSTYNRNIVQKVPVRVMGYVLELLRRDGHCPRVIQILFSTIVYVCLKRGTSNIP